MEEKKTFDITALGELLIDFTENGISDQGNPIMEANPGGAPCNLLAMLTKLGFHTAFIGKVGQDIFGKQLQNALDEVGIDRTGLVIDPDVRTTLAFVHTYSDGDREFSFYRNPGADMMLRPEEVKDSLIADSNIFHMGTLSMTDPIVREATHHAIDVAKKAGCFVSFDPNLRKPLWKKEEDAREAFEYGFSVCDVLKIADNEVLWVTGERDYDSAVAKLQNQYHIPLILLSLGKEGSCAYQGSSKVFCPAFIQKNTIETTGAGDTFFGASLAYLLRHNLRLEGEQNLSEMLTFANAAASLVTTRKGALRVMPSEYEIRELIQSRQTC